MPLHQAWIAASGLNSTISFFHQEGHPQSYVDFANDCVHLEYQKDSWAGRIRNEATGSWFVDGTRVAWTISHVIPDVTPQPAILELVVARKQPMVVDHIHLPARASLNDVRHVLEEKLDELHPGKWLRCPLNDLLYDWKDPFQGIRDHKTRPAGIEVFRTFAEQLWHDRRAADQQLMDAQRAVQNAHVALTSYWNAL